MKTCKTTFKKTLQQAAAIFLVTTIVSCETEIPATDDVDPNFSIRIYGNDFDHTFDQGDDFDNFQLLLREDDEYNFVLTGSDAGGLQRLEMVFQPLFLEFNATITSPWQRTNFSTQSDLISWTGDSSAPLTGTILQGTFIAKGSPTGGTPISISARDYGGSSIYQNLSGGTIDTYVREGGQAAVINH
ncbi:hypothetical protein [Zobellia alginiliquefaciens]|uniref:hypothetical protein n=1 Tax=Zobellia alginiliquefaciens TaxID=3032586 RepID=UPI0023E1101E|nr:hypothetical protein [Zobellia alginiliquefaciens]